MGDMQLYVDGVAQENQIGMEEDVHITLEFPQDDEYYICADCGAWTDVDGTGDDGETECPGNSLGYEHDNDMYPDCGPDCKVDGTSGPEDHFLVETFGEHSPERKPLSWVNSAAIITDPGHDEITVTLSVGDPRGSFAFTLRRVVPDEGEPYLVMHTPYPGEPQSHMPLGYVTEGTCRVLPYGSHAKPRLS